MSYDLAFFAENQRVAARSAAQVMPWILGHLDPQSVIDVGCGSGEWGAVAQRRGIRTRGVDGYATDCAIEDFHTVDLEAGYDCGGWDLAICLEVAEHLPIGSAAALIAGLCNARWVLFSAAHPGQGGVNHVNEQWGTWWELLFATNSRVGTSSVKWHFWTNRDVKEFYRENMLLFGSRDDIIGPPVVDVIHPERLGRW